MQPWQHPTGGDGWRVPPLVLTATAGNAEPEPLQRFRWTGKAFSRLHAAVPWPPVAGNCGGGQTGTGIRWKSSRMAQNRFCGVG